MKRSLDASAWRAYGADGFPHAWRIEGDCLRVLAGRAQEHLVSRERFADFELTLRWCVAPGGNSGVLYRVREDDGEPWHSGPELQLLDDAGHPDGRVPETRCGALYGLFAPLGAPPCPPGRFHEARVVVRATRIEHWLNGTRILICDTALPAFRRRVAQSKFAALPRFGTYADGHLVLQHHGDDAWFRDIEVRAL